MDVNYLKKKTAERTLTTVVHWQFLKEKYIDNENKTKKWDSEILSRTKTNRKPQEQTERLKN